MVLLHFSLYLLESNISTPTTSQSFYTTIHATVSLASRLFSYLRVRRCRAAKHITRQAMATRLTERSGRNCAVSRFCLILRAQGGVRGMSGLTLVTRDLRGKRTPLEQSLLRSRNPRYPYFHLQIRSAF